MPFFYGVEPAVDFTTSAVAGTEIDAMFIAPGTTAAGVVSRTLFVTGCTFQGKAANATSLSGIVVRIKVFTTTASSGGTPVTPNPRDQDVPAAKATAGQATAGVTQGTGGPSVVKIFGGSVSSPGYWQPTPGMVTDQAVRIDAGANKSCDFFNSSNAVSLKFEMDAEIAE